jgi:hypothetical protein
MKNKMRLVQLVLVILAVSLLAGCNQSTGEQQTKKESSPPAALDAIKALWKIESATQVSVNYIQYSQLVIDAKAQVNEASAVLPDGELKTELNAAMDAYADVVLVWKEQVDGARHLWTDLEPGQTLAPKYSLKGEQLDVIAARAIILKTGKDQLDRASKLIQ